MTDTQQSCATLLLNYVAQQSCSQQLSHVAAATKCTTNMASSDTDHEIIASRHMVALQNVELTKKFYRQSTLLTFY